MNLLLNKNDKLKLLFLEYAVSNLNYTLNEGFMDRVKSLVPERARKFGRNFLKGALKQGGKDALNWGINQAVKEVGGKLVRPTYDVVKAGVQAATDDSPETKPAVEAGKQVGNSAVGMGRRMALKSAGTGVAKAIGGKLIGGLAGPIGFAASFAPEMYRATRRGISNALDQDQELGTKVRKAVSPFRPVINVADRLMGHKRIFEPHKDLGKKSKIAASTEINYDNGSYILKERSVMDNHIDARLALKSIFEHVLQQQLINETKRANKEKMANILRKKADWEESGDEFRKAKHLRAMASGRDPGPKGGTGEDSPEAKAKRDARSAGRKTQYGTSVRTPQELADEAKKARQRPDPSDKDAGVKNQARNSRLRKAESAKAKREGKPDPHAPRPRSKYGPSKDFGTMVYRGRNERGEDEYTEWDE